MAAYICVMVVDVLGSEIVMKHILFLPVDDQALGLQSAKAINETLMLREITRYGPHVSAQSPSELLWCLKKT